MYVKYIFDKNKFIKLFGWFMLNKLYIYNLQLGNEVILFLLLESKIEMFCLYLFF